MVLSNPVEMIMGKFGSNEGKEARKSYEPSKSSSTPSIDRRHSLTRAGQEGELKTGRPRETGRPSAPRQRVPPALKRSVDDRAVAPPSTWVAEQARQHAERNLAKLVTDLVRE